MQGQQRQGQRRQGQPVQGQPVQGTGPSGRCLRREVPGRLDAHRVEQLRRDLLADGREPIELDLGSTSFIDMAGIELLEALGEGRHGRPRVTVTGLSQPVRIILELAAACGLVRPGLPASIGRSRLGGADDQGAGR
jgi:hypothetical protein